ncbi:HAD family hydrolase [Pseudonocardia sp. HH130630-07]|uniref:HAD family hydrolase n=1 Tax=Pseudonocardia sp. HH130630-07 TaxID=1690815 RepID=UPI0008152A30|nr:HAD family hydrolase [Pseudonocardia sp. HH130630-07]ANY06671.1 HAD family hydrolase [Pseudonocardia sp. HH130630-07]
MIAENSPRLVASDVDGTLLDDRDAVTPRTAAAVARAVAAGAGFVLVTGRPPRWVPPIVAQLPPGVVRLAVCANGAVLYDVVEDVVLDAHTLGPDAIATVAGLATELFPGCGLAAERASGGGDFRSEPGYLDAWGEQGNAIPRAELLSQPVTKLLVRAPELTSEQMLEALAPKVEGLADLTFSHPRGLLEISAPGITKATGLAEVAARLGVGAAETIAFGDMPNDREMLAWAGTGVAMGNAHPDLVVLADEIAAPNTEDGLAAVLERWF